ncbi:MAG: pyridoxamine 5'-phosphate oxidase family protein [Bacillota bacterium]
MRRKEKEICDINEIKHILAECEILRLAMVDEGEPYLVALNFALIDNSIYVHSAKEGRKVEILQKNPRVAFQTDLGVEVFRTDNVSKCSTKYKCVVGTGNVGFVDDDKEKKKALDALMKKHSGESEFDYPEVLFARTLIIKIEIDTLTGKQSGF